MSEEQTSDREVVKTSPHNGPDKEESVVKKKRAYVFKMKPEERRKRGPRPKDVNAPRAPLNAYVRFLNENRERVRNENPELAFGDITKKLSVIWQGYNEEEKKVYVDAHMKEKEEYMKKLEEYRKSDDYRQFVSEQKTIKENSKKKDADKTPKDNNGTDKKKRKKKKKDAAKNKPTQEVEVFKKPAKKILKHDSFEFPIYTDAFLEHNRARDQELRNIRKTAMDNEEENAILTKHNEDMLARIDELTQIRTQEEEHSMELERIVETINDALKATSLGSIDDVKGSSSSPAFIELQNKLFESFQKL